MMEVFATWFVALCSAGQEEQGEAVIVWNDRFRHPFMLRFSVES
jgi:hypothetical protein